MVRTEKHFTGVDSVTSAITAPAHIQVVADGLFTSGTSIATVTPVM